MLHKLNFLLDKFVISMQKYPRSISRTHSDGIIRYVLENVGFSFMMQELVNFGGSSEASASVRRRRWRAVVFKYRARTFENSLGFVSHREVNGLSNLPIDILWLFLKSMIRLNIYSLA